VRAIRSSVATSPIKVLPTSLTNDPDRLARFQREAQVLAALNHPNIAAIFHVEDARDAPALVMELVEARRLPTAGQVKVLDFGLAKLAATGEASRADPASVSLSLQRSHRLRS